ncbi:hypothetical protein ACFX2F_040294 [Malus domestica]
MLRNYYSLPSRAAHSYDQPLAQWGLDLIGPMPAGKGKVRYAIVVVDYFIKWAEVEPLATIIEAKIENFIWKNIICRFGIPNAIVIDNGR